MSDQPPWEPHDTPPGVPGPPEPATGTGPTPAPGPPGPAPGPGPGSYTVPAPIVGGPVPGPQPGFVFQIADIGVTNDTIVTPSGNAPLAGSVWVGLDYTRTVDKIPTWAIVMAIVFAVFCLLGLLFLLVKENAITGYVEIRVQQGQFWHISHVPVNSRASVDHLMMQIAQAQAFASRQGQ